jgi:predicted flap endonuclease-1-like 5' DNA nuclease
MKGEATPGAKPLTTGAKGIAPQEAPAVAQATPDDLVLIEGIGPKIASLLKASGIMTFRQLAGAQVPVLEKLLKDNGLSFVKPNSWPEQARLAADGKMEELKALQAKLVAGR